MPPKNAFSHQLEKRRAERENVALSSSSSFDGENCPTPPASWLLQQRASNVENCCYQEEQQEEAIEGQGDSNFLLGENQRDGGESKEEQKEERSREVEKDEGSSGTIVVSEDDLFSSAVRLIQNRLIAHRDAVFGEPTAEEEPKAKKGEDNQGKANTDESEEEQHHYHHHDALGSRSEQAACLILSASALSRTLMAVQMRRQGWEVHEAAKLSDAMWTVSNLKKHAPRRSWISLLIVDVFTHEPLSSIVEITRLATEEATRSQDLADMEKKDAYYIHTVLLTRPRPTGAKGFKLLPHSVSENSNSRFASLRQPLAKEFVAEMAKAVNLGNSFGEPQSVADAYRIGFDLVWTRPFDNSACEKISNLFLSALGRWKHRSKVGWASNSNTATVASTSSNYVRIRTMLSDVTDRFFRTDIEIPGAAGRSAGDDKSSPEPDNIDTHPMYVQVLARYEFSLGEIKKLQAEVEGAKAKVAEKEAEAHRLTEEKFALQNEVASLNTALNATVTTNNFAKERVDFMQRKVQDTQKIKSLESLVKGLRERVGSLEQDVETKTIKLGISDAKNHSLAEELTSLKKQLEKESKLCEAYKSKLKSAKYARVVSVRSAAGATDGGEETTDDVGEKIQLEEKREQLMVLVNNNKALRRRLACMEKAWMNLEDRDAGEEGLRLLAELNRPARSPFVESLAPAHRRVQPRQQPRPVFAAGGQTVALTANDKRRQSASSSMFLTPLEHALAESTATSAVTQPLQPPQHIVRGIGREPPASGLAARRGTNPPRRQSVTSMSEEIMPTIALDGLPEDEDDAFISDAMKAVLETRQAVADEHNALEKKGDKLLSDMEVLPEKKTKTKLKAAVQAVQLIGRMKKSPVNKKGDRDVSSPNSPRARKGGSPARAEEDQDLSLSKSLLRSAKYSSFAKKWHSNASDDPLPLSLDVYSRLQSLGDAVDNAITGLIEISEREAQDELSVLSSVLAKAEAALLSYRKGVSPQQLRTLTSRYEELAQKKEEKLAEASTIMLEGENVPLADREKLANEYAALHVEQIVVKEELDRVRAAVSVEGLREYEAVRQQLELISRKFTRDLRPQLIERFDFVPYANSAAEIFALKKRLSQWAHVEEANTSAAMPIGWERDVFGPNLFTFDTLNNALGEVMDTLQQFVAQRRVANENSRQGEEGQHELAVNTEAIATSRRMQTSLKGLVSSTIDSVVHYVDENFKKANQIQEDIKKRGFDARPWNHEVDLNFLTNLVSPSGYVELTPATIAELCVAQHKQILRLMKELKMRVPLSNVQVVDAVQVERQMLKSEHGITKVQKANVPFQIAADTALVARFADYFNDESTAQRQLAKAKFHRSVTTGFSEDVAVQTEKGSGSGDVMANSARRGGDHLLRDKSPLKQLDEQYDPHAALLPRMDGVNGSRSKQAVSEYVVGSTEPLQALPPAMTAHFAAKRSRTSHSTVSSSGRLSSRAVERFLASAGSESVAEGHQQSTVLGGSNGANRGGVVITANPGVGGVMHHTPQKPQTARQSRAYEIATRLAAQREKRNGSKGNLATAEEQLVMYKEI